MKSTLISNFSRRDLSVVFMSSFQHRIGWLFGYIETIPLALNRSHIPSALTLACHGLALASSTRVPFSLYLAPNLLSK